MANTPADLEQLIHEALSLLGWEADASRVAAKLWRLNQGLPREDEFSVLCSWLGKCDLMHKLDQQQSPKVSREKYQVPDLMAVFNADGASVPVLVEVKSNKDNVLSFKPEYRARLLAYAELLRLPLLIAWKHHGMWALFDMTHMKKAQQNFNIDFAAAMTENLLGVLAGDFSYSLGTGTGLHLRFKKEELIKTEKSENGFNEQWKMVCDKVHFTDGRGNVVDELPADVQALILTWDLQKKDEFSPTHVTMSFVAQSDHETAVFAHMALVRLLDWQLTAGDKVDWRALLSQSKILHGIEDFSGAIGEAFRLGLVHHVLHQVPQTWPPFMHRGTKGPP